jgi:hypothetical protein
MTLAKQRDAKRSTMQHGSPGTSGENRAGQEFSNGVAGSTRFRRVLMTNRRTMSLTIFAAAMLALCLPVLAAAQGGYGYPDYGRNRNYGRYDERYVKDSIQRLDRLARDFERDLDRALDHSRVDGTRREDRINAQGHDFRRAVSDLKSSFGNGRDLNRSRDEAQRVMQEARQFENIGRMRNIDNRVASEWSQIQRELNVIADAYGLGYGGYNNGGYYPNNGRNDRNRRNNNNNDWWRRLPFPTTWP